MSMSQALTIIKQTPKQLKTLYNATKHVGVAAPHVKEVRNMSYLQRAKALKELAQNGKHDLFLMRGTSDAARYNSWRNRTGANIRMFFSKKFGNLKTLSKQYEEYQNLLKEAAEINLSKLEKLGIKIITPFKTAAEISDPKNATKIQEAKSSLTSLVDNFSALSKDQPIHEGTFEFLLTNLKNLVKHKKAINDGPKDLNEFTKITSDFLPIFQSNRHHVESKLL